MNASRLVRRALAGAVLLAAAAAGRAGPPGPAQAAPIQGCLRLEGLPHPGDLAAALRDRPPQERRARLVAQLEAAAADAARPLAAVLKEGGAARVTVLWGAGVVCAQAPRVAFAAAERIAGPGTFFETPAQPEALLLDDGGAPNVAVPPEAPLVALRVPEAWSRGFTGRGVVIALIDTGADLAHPDIAPSLWVNPGEIPGNGLDDDGNGYHDDVHGWDFADRDGDPGDAAGHGTAVAGLLVGNGAGGRQTGAAPGASLMVLRRGTSEPRLWEAAQYAVANGADVISQSVSWRWSFTPRPNYAGWRRQADTELAAGVIHVNSAGNTGEALSTDPVPYNVTAPANCPPPWLPPEQSLRGGVSGVVGVGNVDSRSLLLHPSSPHGPAEWTDIATQHPDANYPHEMPPEYRDYPAGDNGMGLIKPDLVAPGENSTTTKLGGGYVGFGGTSAAAPRVAGLFALLREAVPGATPADLFRAAAETARPLAGGGQTHRVGRGLPDAAAAIDALGPPLEVVGVRVIDEGLPRADGDGGADAGEMNRLEVTLRNTSAAALDGVELFLDAGAPVLVRDAYARLGRIEGGATAMTTAPHLGIQFAAGSCGARAALRLELRAAGAGARVAALYLDVGTETRTALVDADFESDAGFERTSEALAGAWVREVPVGTESSGRPFNPAADHGAAPATTCEVTGNGPTAVHAADVDGGRVRLTTPPRDARDFARVELSYARWFASSDAGGEDRFTVEATGDGSSWRVLEEFTADEARWRERALVLSDLVTPGAATRVRFTVEDVGSDDVVEGALDDVRLTGVQLACTPHTLDAGTPSAVGPTLRVSREPGGHLRLEWDAPSASGGSDPALGYTVFASDRPEGGFAAAAYPSLTEWTEKDGAHGAPGSLRCYLVESLTTSP